MKSKQQNNKGIRDKQYLYGQLVQWIFNILIFCGPLMNGWIEKEYFYGAFAIEVLLLFSLFKKKAVLVTKGKWAGLLLTQFVLAGITGLLNSVNKEESIFGIFVLLSMLIFFLLAQNIISPDPVQISLRLLRSLVGSGTVISVVNLVYFAGSSGSLQKPFRMELLLRYANTQAVFLFVCGMFVMYLITITKSKFEKVFLGFAFVVSTTTMILTLSRTMWVLAGLGYFAYFIYFGVMRRHKTTKMVAGLLLCSVVMAWGLSGMKQWTGAVETSSGAMETGESVKVTESVKAEELVEAAVNREMTQNNATGGKSKDLSGRMAAMELKATELQERLATYHDAKSIVGDYLFTGIGAGGWEVLQYPYQTALYSNKYIHSLFWKLVLEHGIFHLLVFMLQIGLFWFCLYKNLRNEQNRPLMVTLGIAMAVLLGHSMLDFDFEFPVIYMVFYLMIAIVVSFHEDKMIFKIEGKYVLWGRGILTVVLILNLVFFGARMLIMEGNNRYKAAQYREAFEEYTRALIINPWSGETNFAIAECLRILKGRDQIEDEFVRRISAAEELSGNLRLGASASLNFFSQSGPEPKNRNREDEIIKAYEKLIGYQPMVIEYYEGLAEALLKKAKKDMKVGRQRDGGECLKQIFELEGRIHKAGKFSEYAFRLKHKPNLVLTEKIKKVVEEAKNLAGG